MATTRDTIVNGPSKYDFSLALFDGDSKNRRTVIFAVKMRENQFTPKPLFADESGGRKIIGQIVAQRAQQGGTFPTQPIMINEVSRESGDGESWMFKGWCGEGQSHRKVSGFYSTNSRTGWIEFTR